MSTNIFTIEVKGRFWQKNKESKKYFISEIDGQNLFLLAENVVATPNGLVFTSQAGIDEAKERLKRKGEFDSKKGSDKSTTESKSHETSNTDVILVLKEILEILKIMNNKIK